jgi:acetolactate synthase regulatory subunit
MRFDSIGLWWEDFDKVKVLKEVKKCIPPERTWELDTYLPGLEEAKEFCVPLMTEVEIGCAAVLKEPLIFDVECYANYFLVAFMSVISGKVFFLELSDSVALNTEKLRWVMQNFCVVSFNGRQYDVPIVSLAIAGKSTRAMKAVSNQIIVEELRPSDILRTQKVKMLKCDHIDLIELAPLNQSLKMCAGRLHARKMQDLPFHPEKVLNEDQITITRWYCVNDLRNTLLLYQALKEEIDLRVGMGKEYDLDLRSKSDAQIAEAVIGHEVQVLNGRRPVAPTIAPGTLYRYKVPAFLVFQSALLRWVLELVRDTIFVVGDHGGVEKPATLNGLKFEIGNGSYRMGIGGLHSMEKGATRRVDGTFVLKDIDVASNYPRIILNQRLYPQHLGSAFLKVYQRIVDRRLQAKARKDDLVAGSLKIVVNGSYGKLGSKYSILYSPDLLIQVTLTGQLALLMLIERLELAGISVVSANTDGIVVKCPVGLQALLAQIVAQWCKDTNFETEEMEYLALYSRDVNNYIAVKKDGTFKSKGAYAEMGIDKNATGQISVDAVTALLVKGIPIRESVRTCKDIRKFVFVRTVNGGAVKDGQYLGKAVRWYYAEGEEGDIIYARSGNRVPRSEGARPLMELPDTFPADVDFSWYEAEAEKMLASIGVSIGANATV